MRITNQMMVNSTMANIQVNKKQVNTLETQLSTQKKINKPSEDPVIAIRALRLRSSLEQVTQYLNKNIPDADSWLKTTEGAAAEKAAPQTAAFGGQVRGPSQGDGVEVAPPLLFAGDAALFLQPGQQGQQRCAGAGRAGQRRFQLGGGQRRVGIPQGVHDL